MKKVVISVVLGMLFSVNGYAQEKYSINKIDVGKDGSVVMEANGSTVKVDKDGNVQMSTNENAAKDKRK